MSDNTPTLEDAIAGTVEDYLEGVHTAIPGRVESYDSATQTAQVQPMIKRGFIDEDGDRQTENLPIVNQVPVVFPRAGAYSITFPLTKGDTVLLIFTETSIDKWITRGGETPVDSGDDRRHVLADAVAIPGLFPVPKATDQAADDALVVSGDIRLGSKDAFDPVALKSELDGLKTIFQNWVPAAGDGGAGLKALVVTGSGGTGPWVINGATKVKAE